MAKYRIRKLVNGEFRVDEKMRHVFKIPLTEWYLNLPFWYWYEKNSSFKTFEDAENFLTVVVKKYCGEGNPTQRDQTLFRQGRACHGLMALRR